MAPISESLTEIIVRISRCLPTLILIPIAPSFHCMDKYYLAGVLKGMGFTFSTEKHEGEE